MNDEPTIMHHVVDSAIPCDCCYGDTYAYNISDEGLIKCEACWLGLNDNDDDNGGK
jgi:hypothetical protein